MRSIFIALALGTALLVNSAAASDAPSYVGTLTGEPEKDTFGYARLGGAQLETIAFIGPAVTFGLRSGDSEKDTIAFRTIAVPVNCRTPQ